MFIIGKKKYQRLSSITISKSLETDFVTFKLCFVKQFSAQKSAKQIEILFSFFNYKQSNNVSLFILNIDNGWKSAIQSITQNLQLQINKVTVISISMCHISDWLIV